MEVAEECLGESELYAEVHDVELRQAFRGAYLAAWSGTAATSWPATYRARKVNS